MNELELARKFGAVPVEDQEDPRLAMAKKFGAKPVVDHQAEYERLRASRGRPPIEQSDPNLNQYFPAGHAALIGAGRTLDKVAEGNRQIGINAEIAAREAMGMPTQEQFAALNQQAQTERFKDEAYAPLRQKMPFATGSGEAAPLAVAPVGQATAAARVLAPALSYGAAGALEYGSPQERAISGGSKFASGLVGGTVGEILGRVINPVRSAMNTPAQQAAQTAADKLGAPLLPSQMTGSETLARVEDSLARAPLSADVMGKVLNAQKDAVNRRAGQAIGTDKPLTAATFAERKAEMGADYAANRASIPGMPAQQPIFTAIDNAEKMLTSGSTKGKENALGMLKELKDKLYNTKQLTPEEYQGWVTDLATEARGTQNTTIKTALKMVGREMDKEARGPLDPAWQELDKQYANMKLLMKPHVVNEATGDVNANQVRSRMLQAHGDKMKTGQLPGPLADVSEFAAAVPQLRAGSPTFERGEIGWSGLLNGLWRYPMAKAITSEGGRDYLSKGLLASPEASGRAGLLAQSASVPLATTPVDLFLLRYLGLLPSQ